MEKLFLVTSRHKQLKNKEGKNIYKVDLLHVNKDYFNDLTPKEEEQATLHNNFLIDYDYIGTVSDILNVYNELTNKGYDVQILNLRGSK